METSIEPDVLARAREIIPGLVAELEKLIVGSPYVVRGCGCIPQRRERELEVAGIIPAGERYPYQIGMRYLWTAKMQEKDGSDANLSASLTFFAEEDVLGEIFARHFKGIPVRLV